MHTTIIYYSLSGNCRFAAEGAAALLGAETMELVPEKAYPEKGFAKFFHGGKSAVFGEAPALRPYSFPAETEQVLLVTPIWAGRIAPPCGASSCGSGRPCGASGSPRCSAAAAAGRKRPPRKSVSCWTGPIWRPR